MALIPYEKQLRQFEVERALTHLSLLINVKTWQRVGSERWRGQWERKREGRLSADYIVSQASQNSRTTHDMSNTSLTASVEKRLDTTQRNIRWLEVRKHKTKDTCFQNHLFAFSKLVSRFFYWSISVKESNYFWYRSREELKTNWIQKFSYQQWDLLHENCV